MHPIHQQRGHAELPHPAPTAFRIARPEIREREQQQHRTDLDRDLPGAVQPKLGLGIDGSPEPSHRLAHHDKAQPQQRSPLRRAVQLVLAEQPQDAARTQAEGHVGGPWKEAEGQVVRRHIALDDRGRPGPIQLGDHRGEGRDGHPQHRAEPHPVGRRKHGHQRHHGHRQTHAVQNVHLKQVGPGAVGQAEHPELKAEQERDPEQVSSPAQTGQHARRRRQSLLFAAVHQERQRHSHQEQKCRRWHAAGKLRDRVRAAIAQLRLGEGIEGVPLEHDDGRQPARPVQELEPARVGFPFRCHCAATPPASADVPVSCPAAAPGGTRCPAVPASHSHPSKAQDCSCLPVSETSAAPGSLRPTESRGRS